MADDKKKKDRGEPAVEFRWDPLQLAGDKTFSTTVRIFVSGWWPEGRPNEIALSCYEKSQKPTDGNRVRIQKGHGTFPLTGLEPGKHYHVVCYIDDRLPVQDMIIVPELPKPKVSKNVLVSVSGVPGKQKFLISIAAEDGIFIPNQPFTFVDGDQVANRKTGENGVATYKADFTEPSRYFEVRAGNTKGLVWQEQVPGPPSVPIQPEFRKAPDPPDYFENGRAAARRHFRRPQPIN